LWYGKQYLTKKLRDEKVSFTVPVHVVWSHAFGKNIMEECGVREFFT
jgi:hypothetical protein